MLPRAKDKVLEIANFVRTNGRIPTSREGELGVYDELIRIRKGISTGVYFGDDLLFIRKHIGDLADVSVPLSKLAKSYKNDIDMIFVGRLPKARSLKEKGINSVQDYMSMRYKDKFMSVEENILGYQKSDFEALRILYPLIYDESMKGYIAILYCCLTQDEFMDLIFSDVNTFNKSCVIHRSNIKNVKQAIDKVLVDRLSQEELVALIDRLGLLGYEKVSRQHICKGLGVSITELKDIQEKALRKLSQYESKKFDYRRSIFGEVVNGKFVSLDELKSEAVS